MEMAIKEDVYRQMRETVNFISRNEYTKLGLTRTERQRLDWFVNRSLDPGEIAVRENVRPYFVSKSISKAIGKIVKSDGYGEKEQKNWEQLRSLGLC
jgi:hypothetical protein